MIALAGVSDNPFEVSSLICSGGVVKTNAAMRNMGTLKRNEIIMGRLVDL